MSQTAEKEGATVARMTQKEAKKRLAKEKKGTRISGADLAPWLDQEIVRKSSEYVFWIGVTPSCPVDSVDVAGINFPKLNQMKVPDPATPSTSKLVPVIGALVRLDESRVRLLVKKLPRTVVRRTGEIKTDPESGLITSKGHLVRIPTEEECKAREEKGKPVNRYVQGANDEPVVRYLYAVLCDNQDSPQRGNEYPESIEEAGIEWPDQLE